MAKLLLLFTVVPLCELYLLLLIDDLIGLWPTVAIVLTTGITGAWLARAEGLRVLQQWQRSMVRGKMPDEGVLGGVLILLGGALLVTPGVVTDLVGFLLLIPATRRYFADKIRFRLQQKIESGTVQVYDLSDFGAIPTDGTMRRGTQPPNVVMDFEAEAVEIDDDDDDVPDRRVLH